MFFPVHQKKPYSGLTLISFLRGSRDMQTRCASDFQTRLWLRVLSVSSERTMHIRPGAQSLAACLSCGRRASGHVRSLSHLLRTSALAGGGRFLFLVRLLCPPPSPPQPASDTDFLQTSPSILVRTSLCPEPPRGSESRPPLHSTPPPPLLLAQPLTGCSAWTLIFSWHGRKLKYWFKPHAPPPGHCPICLAQPESCWDKLREAPSSLCQAGPLLSQPMVPTACPRIHR